MSTYFGAIADDFTGASDLAALLARSGAEVRLRLGVPSAPADQTADFEIIALKSRTCAVEQAISESLNALSWLHNAGAQKFFFKYCSTFDSTNQGNIGPVAEKLMQALGEKQTIYCPAFPENGRTIFMGNLFVGEQLLSESPMKDHPLTPMTDSNLVRLLEAQTTSPVSLANRLIVAQGQVALTNHLKMLEDTGISHVVMDAVANEDLETITQSCAKMGLLTGGSALAMPLPFIYQNEGHISLSNQQSSRPQLNQNAVIFSGSCSAMTQQQVAHYQGPSFQIDPLYIAKNGIDDVCQWLAEQDLTDAPLLYATAAPEEVQEVQNRLGLEQAGSLVEQSFAALARQALQQGARRFIVAGGETSGAVAKALEIDNLLIGEEITPGVPWCFATSCPEPFAIALKSGNFGAPDFFSAALERL